MAGAQPMQYQGSNEVQLLDMLGKLGGTKTTGSVSIDPKAAQGLDQVLAQQLGQITPEGMTQLIQSIFQEGAKKVPQLATTYAQAAGARTSNNSPLKFALGDLNTQLAGEAMKQLLTAQSQAADTASKYGMVTRKENTITKPTAQSYGMMALPFLLGQKKKLAELFGQASGLFSKSGDMAPGVSSPFGFGMNNSGVDAGVGIPGANDYLTSALPAFADSFGSSDLGSFGGFDTAATAGVTDAAPSMDFSGFDFGSLGQLDGGSDLGGGDWLDFKDGGLVSRAKMGRPTTKAKGYADGGIVNEGQRTSDDPINTLVTSQYLPGVVEALMGGQSIRGVSSLSAQGDTSRTGAKNDPYVQPSSTPPKEKSNAVRDYSTDSGNEATIPNQWGTVEENNAALLGVLSLVGGQFGIPSLVTQALAHATGIPMTSMNPVGKGMSLAYHTLQGLLANTATPGEGLDPSAGTSPASVAAGTGISGANSGGLAGLGVSLGLGDNAGGVTPSGGPDTGSVGAGGGSDSDGENFEGGGPVNGRGTGTSDSINVNVSDGEFVVNAEAAQQFLPLLELLNSVGLSKRGTRGKGAR